MYYKLVILVPRKEKFSNTIKFSDKCIVFILDCPTNALPFIVFTVEGNVTLLSFEQYLINVSIFLSYKIPFILA